MLQEFGLKLADDVEVRVWDSTAQLRYLVLPERPPGTENMSESDLAALVTRDSMVGVAKVSVPQRRSSCMNGIHDMGGMQDMGPIRPEKNEPMFHAEWERRVFALYNSSVDEDQSQYEIELIPPADYLRMSYYEKWLTSLTKH